MRMNTLLRSLQTLKELERPVILSISPGTEVTPALAENITQHVDMYRITGDDWDSWKDVRPHFDVARSFADANKITGLRGRSWPDLDMLPFGRLTDAGVNQGPHRSTNLTFDEQLTQVCIALEETSFLFSKLQPKVLQHFCKLA
uniref:Alpha-galactosidase n=1 Tax=Aegilops tauschii subsp. strangulata TaxID=200361 RepID=A0A453PJJ2_AEGTS